MTIEEIINDKNIKSKNKVAQIGDHLLNGVFSLKQLMAFIVTQVGTNKACCIEAIEYATKKNQDIADESLMKLVINSLDEDEPRIKWESAKVVGNICNSFPGQLGDATTRLLSNAKHNGTVVRWASAYALSEILKLKTDLNKTLVPQIEQLSENEVDNGVKKKYLEALKKISK